MVYIVEMSISTKRCPRCERTLPLSEFYVDKKRKDGVSGHCCECHREIDTASARKRRDKFLTLLGGECVRCGFNDLRILQIDHVHGGGNQDPDGHGLSKKRMAKILANPDDYQLLCPNHNELKRMDEKEHVGIRRLNPNPPADDGTTKRCPRCERDLPKSLWMRNAGRKDGLTVYCAECHNQNNAERRQQKRLRMIIALGGICIDCGYCEDHRALQVDHINGDGYLEEGRSRVTYFQKVLENPDLYALRCANCNRLKQIDDDEFRLEPSYQKMATV